MIHTINELLLDAADRIFSVADNLSDRTPFIAATYIFFTLPLTLPIFTVLFLTMPWIEKNSPTK